MLKLPMRKQGVCKSMAGALALAVVLVSASGCVPLAIGAAAGGALVATDRRSVGTQLEDEAIERRLHRAIYAKYPEGTISVYVTSYNRKVLLLGQVTKPEFLPEIEQIAKNSENVREVVNELQVRDLSPAPVRNNDIAITAKVSGAFIESKDVSARAVKVTTERGIVYLLGRVTQEEGDAAAKIASRVSGVNKVVKVFDYLTPEELAEIKASEKTPPTPPARP
ncbi:MAG TPA: BON domain-containing protein [Burkholderiaceae bacterium]|nr:BON domain-containing protein [Burkholderiaceae bacterium]